MLPKLQGIRSVHSLIVKTLITAFFKAVMADCLEKKLMMSLHMKATMMEV